MQALRADILTPKTIKTFASLARTLGFTFKDIHKKIPCSKINETLSLFLTCLKHRDLQVLLRA